MRNIAPVASSLDKLLGQSLVAVGRTDVSDNDAVAHLASILSRIAGFFRNTAAVVAQTVIEPVAAEIEIEGRRVRGPRLLVQCSIPDTFLLPALTFFYTPTNAKRIALRIAFGGTARPVRSDIQWTPKHGWTFPSIGSEVSREAHATFLSDALYEVGLFAAGAMSLEPSNA